MHRREKLTSRRVHSKETAPSPGNEGRGRTEGRGEDDQKTRSAATGRRSPSMFPSPMPGPASEPDFSDIAIPAAGSVAAARTSRVAAAETHPLCYTLIRVLDDDGKAVGPVGPPARRRHAARGAARHDADPRLRRPHVPRPAPGQDQLLHEVHRRGGGRRGRRPCAGPRRHVLPDLSPAGPADRARLSAGRDDVPDLFQPRRPAEGPPAADHVFGPGVRLLHHLRQSRHPVSAGGGLGDGLGLSRATAGSPRPGSATARPRRATSTTR